MNHFGSTDRLTHRRAFLGTLALGASALSARGAFAEALLRTPSQTEGPFYPDKLPLDTDNDLIIVNDGLTAAVGEVTHLTGRVLDSKGDPIRNALIEIWQCDANGAYLHTKDPAHGKYNPNFQGFGRFLTSSTGEYYFRTIKPVPYTGRTPHIHVKVRKGNKELLTTQFYIKGHPGNEHDGIYRELRDPKDRDAVTLAFNPVEGSKVGELSARGDLVIGLTPEA